MAQRTLTDLERELAAALADMLNPGNFRKDHTPESIKARDHAYNRAAALLDDLGVKIPLPKGEPVSAGLRAAMDAARKG